MYCYKWNDTIWKININEFKLEFYIQLIDGLYSPERRICSDAKKRNVI
jgi:hypothetical protein